MKISSVAMANKWTKRRKITMNIKHQYKALCLLAALTVITNLKNSVGMSLKLVVALLLLSGWTTAQAATIFFTTGWGFENSINSGTKVDNQFDSLNAFRNESISQFDPSLGILTGINIDFFVMSLTSIASANFRDNTIFSTVGGFQRLQSMSLDITMPNYSFNRSASTRTSMCSDTGGVFSSSSCNTSIAFTNNGLLDASTSFGPLSAYIGSGFVNIGVNQNATLFTNETDGDNGYVNTRFGQVRTVGSVRVTYDYSVVPVPAAAWLFCSGLIGLIGVARRKA